MGLLGLSSLIPLKKRNCKGTTRNFLPPFRPLIGFFPFEVELQYQKSKATGLMWAQQDCSLSTSEPRRQRVSVLSDAGLGLLLFRWMVVEKEGRMWPLESLDCDAITSRATGSDVINISRNGQIFSQNEQLPGHDNITSSHPRSDIITPLARLP